MRLAKPLLLASILVSVSLNASARPFRLSSPDIAAGKTIAKTYVFNGFGCHGDNQSPALHWQGEPKGTQSFAITVYDPDAPTGSGWWHWAVANIPATVHNLPRNAGQANSAMLPTGAVQLRTDFGTSAYGGPCPPAGDKPHHYQFKVYALDVKTLPVSSDSSPALMGFMVHQHALSVAKLVARYEH
ncbi:YbhB/YbcL family Raf kinase inhibitor-like protein [Mangrovitalea sediminis]|uniref:YbhB/YbcL family Raf kinase inhibitor-like protein n=1 Tax=Mangrovitalea sediminis TaxID=1982043 RepID=UPI000BE5AC72|nr:YbhB/YbcL family Raf kinase inhibitor-like protein [Mangrovitalea sediminis]